jgi:hypothetical protein
MRQIVLSAVGLGLSVLFARAAVGAEAVAPIPPGGDSQQMDRFYTSGTAQIGEFPGTLVCLRDDLTVAPMGKEECPHNGQTFALAMENGWAIHPLLPGTKGAMESISAKDLRGHKVVIYGKYYPAEGMILVSKVVPEKGTPPAAMVQ